MGFGAQTGDFSSLSLLLLRLKTKKENHKINERKYLHALIPSDKYFFFLVINRPVFGNVVCKYFFL